jgi:hypothetical protein
MTFQDDLFHADRLDDELADLEQTMDQPSKTPSQRAYHNLRLFYAAQADQEAQALERVRQRLLASAPVLSGVVTTPAAQRPRQTAHPWVIIRNVAVVLVVAVLLSAFGALLHERQGATPLAGYHFSIIPSPNTSLAVNSLTGITVRSSNDAWAWGDANVAPTNGSGTASNPIQTPLVEHWDGSQWRIVATPPVPYGGQIAGIAALAQDNAWAVGGLLITSRSSDNTTGATLIEHWDGHTWTIQPDQVVNANLNALAALSANDIWAVGSSDSGAQSGLIQHWDGHGWQTIAHPEPSSGAQFSAITALAPDDIWVVGQENAGHNAIFEHWDGARWTIVPSPSAGGVGPVASHRMLFAISAVSATDVWAAGVEDPAIPFPNGAVPLFEHWDGHTWSVVASPSLSGQISSIAALGPDDVWAVGLQGFGIDTAQQGQGLIEHWDGQQWSVIANPTPQPFTQLNSVARDPTTPGKLWVVGATGPTHGGDQLFSTQTLIETTG